MPGFLDSLKESFMGKEVELPICSLPRRKPLNVFYTYYEGIPQSHRLEFRKKKRTKFEMFLPHYGEDISQLCSVMEGHDYRKGNDETVFGFWSHLALRLTAGKPISCRDIYSGPSSELHTQVGEARSGYRYRLAYCQKGAQEAIVIISSRHGSESSTYRKSQSTELNWLKMSLGEFRKLTEYLRSFIDSTSLPK